ncbi:MAG: 3-hydroxyacyl-ACP dehydratase FabZ [Methylococcales symbiont of Hymedesmia sp. n. MRB-2018]|nr:MAG: 3-hydroxyacyl-ACP dehydratase FabZ [Methylococcales symbiont of Hymedesmia sp. n. MRB-2018]KAF3983480.1 MAG: 3-hydroxyacyl-ACP dehydratase FabZ [Methylococcales symbiont of Hymedesmia sp. n. MRB-2018]
MTGQLDILQIQKILPHRYPFLLIDKVLECDPKVRLFALKNVTFNEPFFQGHFPENPVFPGVLMIEAMAQATAILTAQSDDQFAKDTTYFLASVDKARFKKQVKPGDQIIIEAIFIKSKRHLWSFECSAKVDERLVANANIICAAVV